MAADSLSYEEVIHWTLERYSKGFTGSKKILLLQYRTNFNNDRTLQIRSIILKDAKNHNYLLIDSLDLFKKYKDSDVWSGHHTKFGNKLICSEIYSKLIGNKF